MAHTTIRSLDAEHICLLLIYASLLLMLSRKLFIVVEQVQNKWLAVMLSKLYCHCENGIGSSSLGVDSLKKHVLQRRQLRELNHTTTFG